MEARFILTTDKLSHKSCFDGVIQLLRQQGIVMNYSLTPNVKDFTCQFYVDSLSILWRFYDDQYGSTLIDYITEYTDFWTVSDRVIQLMLGEAKVIRGS